MGLRLIGYSDYLSSIAVDWMAGANMCSCQYPPWDEPRILRAWLSVWLSFYPSGFHRSVSNPGRRATLHRTHGVGNREAQRYQVIVPIRVASGSS